MKKKLLILLLICLCVTALALVGCIDNVFVVDKISVDIPCRLTYQIGESLDVTGGVLKVTYSNGATELIPFTDERISFSELKKEEPGVQQITVRFGNQFTSLSVTVVRQLTALEILTLPAKTVYQQGEKLNLTGFLVKGTFEGGFQLDLDQDSLVVTGFDTAKVGTQTLTAKLKGDDSDISVTFDVTVEEKIVKGFSYETFPTKRNYAIGSALDLSDAKMRIEYTTGVPAYATLVLQDGKYYLKDAVSGEFYEDEVEVFSTYNKVTTAGFDGTKEGDHEISLKYRGRTAFGYSLRVLEKVINGYKVENQQQISKHTPTDRIVDLFMQDFVLTLTYSDDDVREYRFPQDYQSGTVTISGYDEKSNEDKQTLTFDVGIYGIQEILFQMKEPVVTNLEMTDSGIYVPEDGAFLFYTDDVLSIKDWMFTLKRDNGTQDQYKANNLTITTSADATIYTQVDQTFRFKTAETYTVTVSYYNIVQTEFTISVKNKVLKELILQSEPSKKEYIVGETIEVSGLQLIATYQEEGSADGLEVRRRNVLVLPPELGLQFIYDNQTANDEAIVTVKLTENEVTKTVTFTVKFNAVVEGIAVKDTNNAKLTYILGETFNPANLVITVSYIGEADKDITLQQTNDAAWSFTPQVFTTLGEKTVTISYLGNTTQLTVNVTNDIHEFRLLQNDTVFNEGDTVGAITQGLQLNLKGYRLLVIRQNGETEEFVLPASTVTIFADNSGDVATKPTLEVLVSHGGYQAVFYMTRKAREHAYYQLNGQWKTLQIATKGFDPTGLKLFEYFDNGTVNELIFGTDYTFYHDPITVPAGKDRATGEVSIKINQTPIAFRRSANGSDVNFVSVVFFSRIAVAMSFAQKKDILVDENSTLDQVKAAFAASGMTFNVTFKGEATTVEEISIQNADGSFNEDFKIVGYKDNTNITHSISIIYTLGEETVTFVNYSLSINPKELHAIEFAGGSYLIGAIGTTQPNTVVEHTDLNYEYAYLNVTYRYDYANGTNRILSPVRVMVQKAWSDFTKDKANGIDGAQIPVTITYKYKGKTEKQLSVNTQITLKGKTIVGVEFSKSPQTSYIEGQDFSYDAIDGAPARVRVNYSNGTYEEADLTQKNIDNGTIGINRNTLKDLFAEYGGYDKVELINSNEVICELELTYKGRVLTHQMIIKDRPYVRFEYDITGTQNKRYGDPVSVLLSVTYNGQIITEGIKEYSFVNQLGKEFVPNGAGFTMDSTTYQYLPAGTYDVRAVYSGVVLKYNAEEQVSRPFTVAVKDLILKYRVFPSVVFGDQNPDFLAHLYSDTFAAGEGLSNLDGTLKYTAQWQGMAVNVPKNAGIYRLSVDAGSISSNNYNIIVPGAFGTAHGMYEIQKRDVYIRPTAKNILYGEIITTIAYEAYSDDAFSTQLDPTYALQLHGAPSSLNSGVTDGDAPVTSPNVGKYLIIAGGMSDQNPNFNIHFTQDDVYLTIQRAALTAEFTGAQSTYGTLVDGAFFVGKLTITGWKAEDEGNVPYEVKFQINGNGAYLFGNALTSALKNAGTYQLLPGEIYFANYEVTTYIANNYVVHKKDVYFSANSVSKTYGSADPTGYTYTVEGLEAGDTLTGAPARAAGENVANEAGELNKYLIGIGTLENSNYNLLLADKKGYLTITPKELILGIADGDLVKKYDGKAPSIAEYTLSEVNATETSKLNYIEGTGPNEKLIRLYFDTTAPDRTPNPLRVRLENKDTNHVIMLNRNYTYQIEQLPVPVKWLGDGFVLTNGGAYPYKYNEAHTFTAVADLTDIEGLAKPEAENIQLRFDRRFDGLLNGATGKYGVTNVGVYNMVVEGTVNSNFRLLTTSSTQSTVSITFQIQPNTVYIALDEAARSKEYDGNRASINKQNTQMFTLYEDGRDPKTGVVDKNNKVQIMDAQKIAKILSVSNFTVGIGDTSNVNKAGYLITVNIDPGDPMLGKNIKLELNDAESATYMIKQLQITATINRDQEKISKAYDGKPPFIDYTALTSSSSGLLSSKMLESMLGYVPKVVDGVSTIDKMGDAGKYDVVINTESASENFKIELAETDYVYTIHPKNIILVFKSGEGYYSGVRQLAVSADDVIVRDNNLGQGDVWADVFRALSFTYTYQGSGTLAQNNTNGQLGNVGAYTVELDFNDNKSTHKNYTFEWFDSKTFKIKPAEVSILPKNTTTIYGTDEANAPYRTQYDVRFDRGTDGSADFSGSAFKALVKDVFRLSRSNLERVTVGLYDIALDPAWVSATTDGVHTMFPNYRVSMSSLDSRQRFQITKKQITVQIGDVHKTYGSTIDTTQIPIFFPKWEQEKAWADTLSGVLSVYNPTLLGEKDGLPYYGFNEQYLFKYTGKEVMSSTPVVPSALSTRESNGTGGVHGYTIELMRLFGADNYSFAYDQTAKGTAYVDPKELSVTFDSTQWVYLDPWTTGGDESFDNFAATLKVNGFIDGMGDVLKYPVLLKDGAFGTVLDKLTKSGVAGNQFGIQKDWFDITASNSANRNYLFNFDAIDGSQQLSIQKATLYGVIKTVDDQAQIAKPYGTLPTADELKVVYLGLRGTDTEAVLTGASLPDFVQSYDTVTNIARLYGYQAGGHVIRPDVSTFMADNYELNVMSEQIPNPFVFMVEKRPLTVRSMATSGTASELSTFWGTPLIKDTHYDVEFSGFVTEVTLTNSNIKAIVEDNENTVFYNVSPSTEWVSYSKDVNVVKNVASNPTPIEPNLVAMNQIGYNYQVEAVAGADLKVHIYNKVANIELASKMDDNQYGYVIERAASANQLRVKLSYINGETYFVNLPLTTTTFTADTLFGAFSMQGYVATEKGNQTVTLTYEEQNTLAGGIDQKINQITVRNIAATDSMLATGDLSIASLVGNAVNAISGSVPHLVKSTSGGESESRVKAFDLVKMSFVLLPGSAVGATFDIVIDNLNGNRYILRIAKGQSSSGTQRIRVIEQTKQSSNSYLEVNTNYYTIGGIDMFDAKLHTYQLYLNKLTNTLVLVVDNSYVVSHQITAGKLQVENSLTLEFGSIYAYITDFEMGRQGYTEEDAVRLIANNKETVLTLAEGEPLRNLTPSSMFAFLWNYAHEFYSSEVTAPVIRYYLNGAELTSTQISLTAGNYILTAKAFRGDSSQVPIATATTYLSIVEGYYKDSLTETDADGNQTVYHPSISHPTGITSVPAGGKTFMGAADVNYTHYSISFSELRFGQDQGDNSATVDFNIKSNSPGSSAFDIPTTDVDYVGLALRIRKIGINVTTSVRLIGGDGETSFRKEVVANQVIDWTKTGGTYTINATMDKKNLFVTIDILFNGVSIYKFLLDGSDGAQNNGGETVAAKPSDSGHVTVDKDIKQYAPMAYAVKLLTSKRMRHSVMMKNVSGIYIAELVVNTHTELLTNYIRQLSTAQSNTAELKPHVDEKGTKSELVSGAGQEIQYMITNNGFAAGAETKLEASANRYETYGVRFKAKPAGTGTSKLRFILAENAPKTDAEQANRFTTRASRNISLTFMRKSGVSLLYVSWNDNQLNSSTDDFGEPDKRYEQLLYSFTDTAGAGQINLFDEKEHTVVVGFDRQEVSIENSLGLTNAQGYTGNRLKVYVDGAQVGANFYIPLYNNGNSWRYLDSSDQWHDALDTATVAPYHDRYFLNERTYAGVSFRGLTFTLYDLAVSEGKDHWSFLKR